MMIRPCSSREPRSCKRAAAFTRGLWTLVMIIAKSLRSHEAGDPADPGDRTGEKRGVDDVEHAAKPAKPSAAVFALHIALEERLGEVAGHAGQRQKAAVRHAGDRGRLDVTAANDHGHREMKKGPGGQAR